LRESQFIHSFYDPRNARSQSAPTVTLRPTAAIDRRYSLISGALRWDRLSEAARGLLCRAARVTP
jgi:hypothetical protein